jgi:hypothetical protein
MRREDDHLLLPSAEIQNARSYISTPHCLHVIVLSKHLGRLNLLHAASLTHATGNQNVGHKGPFEPWKDLPDGR